MDTYKNNYKKSEDHTLWELHEIRHQIHENRKKKSLKEINKSALKKYLEWQEYRKKDNSK